MNYEKKIQQVLSDIEELRSFAYRKLRMSHDEKERIRHEAYEKAYSGAIEILNNHLEG